MEAIKLSNSNFIGNFDLLKSIQSLPTFAVAPPTPALPHPITPPEHISIQTYNEQLSYWRQKLASATEILKLPNDRIRPSEASGNVIQYIFSLEHTTVAELQNISLNSRTSLFVVLLTLFQAFLQRYTSENDIIVGIPSCNNSNMLALRTNCDNEPSFLTLLKQVHLNQLEAQSNKDVPLQRILEELKIQLNSSYHPLFQIAFILQNKIGDNILVPNLISINSYDLTLIAKLDNNDLTLSFNYATDLFDLSTIVRMAKHFQMFIQQAINKPNISINKLSLMDSAELEQILTEWNNNKTDIPQICVHELFEKQAENSPNRIAISHNNDSLTYCELNKQANRLAYFLRSQGIGPNKIVAVCIERSVGLITTLLAIAKAGGAYLPIDPNYPPERIKFMINDSNASLLITNRKNCAHLKDNFTNDIELAPNRILMVEDLSGITVNNINTNLKTINNSNDLAYIIYTSGSSGQPKGVPIRIRSLINLIQWHQKTYHFTTEYNASMLAGEAFDASAWELWPHITAGAHIHIADKTILLEPKQFLTWLKQLKINISFMPTPLAELVLRENDNIPSLRYLLTGGERLSSYPSADSRFELFNHYGPTESTVVTTQARIVKNTRINPTIGKPISNTRIYVLDKFKQPTPIGVPGELYIGGEGLTPGYINREELNIEKFIINPFNENEILYKTGDLVRWLPNGDLDYIDRIDNQVKIRGHRIELGEIESQLAGHPNIDQAVTIVKENMDDKYLVAYYTTQENNIVIKPDELRKFLEIRLQSYMIPRFFVKLDKFPLTHNGKIDRKALPDPMHITEIVSTEATTQKLSVTETVIENVLSELLKTNTINPDSNFFDLGVHSLMLARACSLLNERLHKTIKIVDLFNYPTITALAKFIDKSNVNTINTHSINGKVQQRKQIRAQLQERKAFG